MRSRRKKNSSSNGRRITLFLTKSKLGIHYSFLIPNGESQMVVKIAIVHFIDQLLQSMSNVQLVRQHSFPYVCTFSPPRRVRRKQSCVSPSVAAVPKADGGGVPAKPSMSLPSPPSRRLRRKTSVVESLPGSPCAGPAGASLVMSTPSRRLGRQTSTFALVQTPPSSRRLRLKTRVDDGPLIRDALPGENVRGAAEEVGAELICDPLPLSAFRSSELVRRFEPVLPGVLLEALFVELAWRFGRERSGKLIQEPWFCDLEAWGLLVNDFLNAGGNVHQEDPAILESLFPVVQETLFSLVRRVVSDAASGVQVRGTDEQRLRDLARDGWHRRAARGDGNNCLAFSLLRLLMCHGLLVDSITDAEQIEACRALRWHLINDPRLRPRDASGRPCPEAYLQHHRHAEACIQFFLEHFRERHARVTMPQAGVRLTVHCRWEVELGHPVDRIDLCRAAGALDQQLDFRVYNKTGHGLDGFHYDALVPSLHALDGGEEIVVVDGVGVGDSADVSSSSCGVVGSLLPTDGASPGAALGRGAQTTVGRRRGARGSSDAACSRGGTPAAAVTTGLKRRKVTGGEAASRVGTGHAAASEGARASATQWALDAAGIGGGSVAPSQQPQERRQPAARQQAGIAVRGRGGRRGVVSGFGEERTEDALGDRQVRDDEANARARHRREEWVRGRVQDLQGNDLDRSLGGASAAGRTRR